MAIELPEESKQRIITSGSNHMTVGKRNNKTISLYNSDNANTVSNAVAASATADESDIDVTNSNNEEQQM